MRLLWWWCCHGSEVAVVVCFGLIAVQRKQKRTQRTSKDKKQLCCLGRLLST